MKMKYFIISTLAGLIVLSAWAADKGGQLRKATWLVGTWENKTRRSPIYETWTQVSDMALQGQSYMILGRDTIVFERIQLIERSDTLYYIPTVEKQNNARPVTFTLKKITEDELVFENEAHDFPQLISYTRISADSLLAEISGQTNGKVRKQTFPMKRVK